MILTQNTDLFIILGPILGTVILAGLIWLIVVLIRRKKRKKADEAVTATVKTSANALSLCFGGNDNIRQISAKGSRVTVRVLDPTKVDRKGIATIIDNAMYMGDKVVFVIGTESQEFTRLLEENVSKTEHE